MTVTFKEEISESRRARNTQGSRSYTRAFRLETSLQSEDAYDVGSHASLPVIGDTFPSDLNAYCHDIQIDNSDPWKGWIATYEYSDKRQVTPAAQAGTGVIDEITYEFSSQIYQDEIEEAYKVAGSSIGPIEAIRNSAGMPFQDIMLADHASLVIKVRFSLLGGVPVEALTYLNSINDAAITINGLPIPKGLAKFHGVTIGNREIRGVYATGPLAGNQIIYYPVAYELHARPAGWFNTKQNVGLMHLENPTDEKPKACKDKEGEPVTEPVPLDDVGKQQAGPDATNATYKTYSPYPEKNFSLLIGVN